MTEIPFYTDIYSFPGPDKHNHNCHAPQYKRSQVIETSKEVIINDAMGTKRYAIKLISSTLEDGILGFQVQVVHYYPSDTSDDNNLLLTIPNHGFETDYHKIKKEFDTCVQRYDSLVKSEVQDFRDIDIYKDKIGYEKTQPDCCAFCKWCRKRGRHHDHHGKHHVLECHNPNNEKQFSYMVDSPMFPNKNAHRYCPSSWQTLPWQQEDPFKRHPFIADEILNRIFPTVDQFGKCKNFEKRTEKPYNDQPDDDEQHPTVIIDDDDSGFDAIDN